MLRWIARFVLFRLLGGRVLVVLAVLEFIRRRFAAPRRTGGNPRQPGDERFEEPAGEPPQVDEPGMTSAYQPSQGESQIVQRDPRYWRQPRSRSVS